MTFTLVCLNFGTCICASLSTGLSLLSKSNTKGGKLSNGILVLGLSPEKQRNHCPSIWVSNTFSING